MVLARNDDDDDRPVMDPGFGFDWPGLVTDSVLDWVWSFVTNRMQQIAYSGQLSSVQLVLFAVSQGSALGQLLYVLYRAELALDVNCHGLSLQHADDTVTQVYISTLAGDRLLSDISLHVLSRSRHG